MNIKKLLLLTVLLGGMQASYAAPNDEEMPDLSEMGIDFESEDFQKMLQQLESQVTKMKDNLSPEKRQQLEEMEQTTQRLQEKMIGLQDKIQDLARQKAERKARVKELREQKDRLAIDKQKLLKVIEELSDVAAGGQDAAEAVSEDERMEKKAELEELDKQIAETDTEIEDVRSVKRNIKTDLKEKESELASAEKEMEEEQKKGEGIFEGVEMSFDEFAPTSEGEKDPLAEEGSDDASFDDDTDLNDDDLVADKQSSVNTNEPTDQFAQDQAAK